MPWYQLFVNLAQQGGALLTAFRSPIAGAYKPQSEPRLQ